MRSLVKASRFLLPACLGFAAAVEALAAQTGGTHKYHVERQIKLGGDGRWDYIVLDTASNRLFIARQDRVMVVDPDHGKLLGEVRGLDGAHGVALDPASKHVFTFNGDAHSSTVVDPASGQALGSIDLGGKPEFGVSAGDGKLYVNIEDRAEIAEIDAAAQKVTRRWSLAPCTEPTGLAIDREHHRLFSGCHNRVMAISDATTGKVIATVPIGGGVDGDGFDPVTGLAFSSDGEGTLTVVHQDSPTRYRVVSTVPTKRGARTMALDPRTHRISTVTADLGPPPAPTEEQPHPRPTIVPDTFTLLVLER